jgi:hypothetical protein
MAPATFPQFTRLPLEIRQQIYAAAAQRPEGARKVLRRWYEKKDVREQIAKLQFEDPTKTYVPVYGDENPYFGNMDYISDDDENGEEDDEDEDNDDEDGDENDEDEDEPEEEYEEDEDEDSDEETDEDGDVVMEEAEPHKLASEPVHPASKWRHVTKFLRISGTPPPLALMMVSKQIHDETKDFFYDVAVLTIDATGSICHTSMFEEALQQIAEASFSPFECIRKIEIKFVWDTQWLRSPACNGFESIFQCLLRERVAAIAVALQRAPELKELTLDWQDSLQDYESVTFQLDILQKLSGLPVKAILKENYLAPGQKPADKSAIGNMRRDLQSTADNGFVALL